MGGKLTVKFEPEVNSEKLQSLKEDDLFIMIEVTQPQEFLELIGGDQITLDSLDIDNLLAFEYQFLSINPS